MHFILSRPPKTVRNFQRCKNRKRSSRWSKTTIFCRSQWKRGQRAGFFYHICFCRVLAVICATLSFRSSPLRSTLSTGYIKVRTCVRVCTEAVHCVALGLWKQKNVTTLPRFSGRRQKQLEGFKVTCHLSSNKSRCSKCLMLQTSGGIRKLELGHQFSIILAFAGRLPSTKNAGAD